jgi:hypothetical protein
MTEIESLFCATCGDRLIFLDYGSRHGCHTYTFVFRIRGETVNAAARDLENLTGLTRAEGFDRLNYWLTAGLDLP